MNIEYKNGIVPEIEELEFLYNDASWHSYTNNIEQLLVAVQNSLIVITAWDNRKLVGLVRAVGDGVTIVYIQDVLVLKQYKRNGIGSRLINSVLEEFPYVRQKVLITDNTTETKEFYKSIGFSDAESKNLIAFINC